MTSSHGKLEEHGNSTLNLYEASDASLLSRAAAYCSAAATTRPAVLGLVAPKGGEGVRTVANLLAETIAMEFRSDVFVIDAIGRSRSRRFVPPARPVDERARGIQRDAVRIPSVPECADFVAQLREAAGVVLVALPPVLSSSAALRLAPHIDGFILVIDSQSTRWQVAKAARDALQDARGAVVGAILNKRKRIIPESIYQML